MDEYENQDRLTQCCYQKQIGEFIQKAEEQGVYSFMVNDVCASELFPLLMRYRIGATWTVCCGSYIYNEDVVKCVRGIYDETFWLAENEKHPAGDYRGIKQLNMMFDSFMDNEECRDLLEFCKDSVMVSKREHAINALCITDSINGEPDLVLIGFNESFFNDRQFACPFVGVLMTGECASKYSEHVIRMARISRIRNLFSNNKEESNG